MRWRAGAEAGLGEGWAAGVTVVDMFVESHEREKRRQEEERYLFISM